MLKKSGKKVALIEANKVAEGVSAYTTAKITSQHLLIYRYLIDKFGFDLAKQYADANQNAVETIKKLIEEYKIDCDFIEKTAYTYAENNETLKKVFEEVESAKQLGLPAYFSEKVPLPIPTKGAICFSGQAQFHPRKYLLSLAEKINGGGSYIFENTRAINLKESDPCIVYTTKGNIYVKDIVITTHFPFYDKPGKYFARMEAGRIYTFAMKIKDKFPDGVFISAEKDIYSFRSQKYNENELIITGGQEHITGRVEDTMSRFENLHNYVKNYFNIEYMEFCWSCQDNNSVDMVPYIGRYLPESRHLFVATGFSGWGITHGTISGILITDLINGIKNSWEEIYNPARFKLSESKGKKISQVKKKTKKKREIIKIKNPYYFLSLLNDREGKIFDMEGEKIAVFKGDDDTGYFLNAICPHMDCLVRWNNAEKSWDCPCHGSRFNYDGKVLNSPAYKDLKIIHKIE
jgi:glycine/D-amino acid oxidase-like deaminating enzyme/nitrite reductase/ring-hydroxylating ferredoxin subunit